MLVSCQYPNVSRTTLGGGNFTTWLSLRLHQYYCILQHIIIFNISSSCIWIWECADCQWVSMMSVIIIFNMIADMTAMTVCDTTDMTVMTVLHDCHVLSQIVTWESVRAGGRRSRPRRPCRCCCCSCRRTRAPSRGTRPAHTQFAKLSSNRARNEPSVKCSQLRRRSHGWKCLLVLSHLAIKDTIKALH